jgi:hypothetical protein
MVVNDAGLVAFTPVPNGTGTLAGAAAFAVTCGAEEVEAADFVASTADVFGLPDASAGGVGRASAPAGGRSQSQR